jgi:Mce-associated membrane protein
VVGVNEGADVVNDVATEALTPAADLRPGRRWLSRGFAVVAVLGLAGTILFASLWSGLRHQRDTEHSVARVARQFTLVLTNFDAKTVDADFDRIIGYATGDFLDQARATFGADLRKALIERQASSRGQIRFLFTEDVKGDTADVFVVVDQTIANNVLKSPQDDEVRMDIALKKVSGEWRVSELTVLQAPPVPTGLVGTTTTTTPAH